MTAAQGSYISRRGETPVISKLTAYLLNFDGTDVLEFQDTDAAREAADRMRSRETQVVIEARYNKVFLRIYK